MDIYSLFKLLHVVCAIAWVGGGLTLLAYSALITRTRGDLETLRTLDAMNTLGKAWFMPASLLTLVFGVIAAVLGGMWMDSWVLFGLAGFAATFFTGFFVLEPTGRAVAQLIEADRVPEALSKGLYLLRVSKFDYTVMMVVVADMVLKPTWADLPLIAVFAAIIAAGAWLFLYGGKLPARTQTA